MLNCKKIEILKQNIADLIKGSNEIDENTIFDFAKQQAKEMRIEITKGEIKSIVINIITSMKKYPENFNNKSEFYTPNCIMYEHDFEEFFKPNFDL